MGWLVLFLILYVAVLFAEEALIRLSPHDFDLLRSGAASKSQRAAAVARELRPALAALVLARLLLKTLFAVGLGAWFLRAAPIREGLYQIGQELDLPGIIVWGVAGVLAAFLLAFLLWSVKRIGLQRFARLQPALWLQRLAPVILAWKTVFKPFIRQEKLLDYPSKPVAIDQISGAEPAHVAGEKRELELLKSIVQFGDTTVKQVMQPRSKVVAVDFRTDFHALLQVVRESVFSRIPVYDEDLDNTTGILYVKDLVKYLDQGSDFEWQPLIRTNLLFAPESKGCSELLQEFKQQKIHMAIVVDEYGGCSGIVTMEDLLEEVTGDIQDEFDGESDVRYRKLDDYNFLFEGQTLLNDVCRIAGLVSGAFDEARNTADTLAGLALELRGDIPPAGAEIEWNGFLLTVVAANNRRIEQIKLRIPEK
ncbi:MAG: transporter associated domain-containing protein [Bacteroidota bacterium]